MIRTKTEAATSDLTIRCTERQAAHPALTGGRLPCSYDPDMELDRLPGHGLVLAGIDDLENGRRTAESLLVSIGAERLRAAGLDVPAAPPTDGYPEHALYELLASDEPESAYGRYNALLRRLVSFERALEHARAG